MEAEQNSVSSVLRSWVRNTLRREKGATMAHCPTCGTPEWEGPKTKSMTDFEAAFDRIGRKAKAMAGRIERLSARDLTITVEPPSASKVAEIRDRIRERFDDG